MKRDDRPSCSHPPPGENVQDLYEGEHTHSPHFLLTSLESFLNYMQAYTATGLFREPITCFWSFAFSIFHAHIFPITVGSLASRIGLNHSDETNDVMQVLVHAP